MNPITDIVRSHLTAHLRHKLIELQRAYHEDLAELNFIQSGSLLTDFHSWKRMRSQELMQALCSGHLDADDLAQIGSLMSGHIGPNEFFLPDMSGQDADGARFGEGVYVDSDDEERGLDELSLPRLVLEELSVLKRVNELKSAGLWSSDDKQSQDGRDTPTQNSEPTPSLSALAPPCERTTTERVHRDYMYAELRWLAEDFKRERQWKKTCGKKLALAALKSYKERTERSIRAEKEQVVRMRKHCSIIARMIREWWRQIDKIVEAKQQARLSAKRQRAMTTHLGRVLETTEEYTRWLTEGITGPKSQALTITTNVGDGDLSESTSDMPDSVEIHQSTTSKSSKKRFSNIRHDMDASDDEFMADEEALAEASDDDEETIEKAELEEALLPGAELVGVELERLEAEAMCPLDELLPPGYLESLINERPASNNGKDDPPMTDEVTLTPHSDQSYKGTSSNETDDEMTIDAQERHENETKECELSVEDEVAQLQREADLPLETLLAQVMPPMPEENDEVLNVNVQSDSENTYSEASESELTSTSSNQSGSETTTREEDSESFEDASLHELFSDKEMDVDQPPPSITEPQSDVPSACEEQKELETLTTEALNAQPKGTTLTDTNLNVPVPFLLTGGTLREYQLVGLNWLATTYDKRLNGILADEMGLGKTIQTIALLAYLACEHSVWGPHLIVVPTSVLLNWEIEFKRWCPGFKILTYFGHFRDRKEKRKGWTKTNAFHVCITSYRLAIQDAPIFKRKKWKYLILDEAQNIKNFKSQRWQTLLTFNSQQRLLLTGTPLQNSLMELWSLMHFLMPNIFQSHRDFQEWFASPLTGMIEGNSEYNEQLVARLHKVLRPFLLRRLKADVEKQMPKKFEHVLMCRLSRRQRFLYDDFMSLSSTCDTLRSGQFLSVMNVLMQLRKVCNHPNLFETRPILSPFRMIDYMVDFPLPRLLTNVCYPLLLFAPRSNGGPSMTRSACSAYYEPDLDWLDRAGAAARLLGQMENVVEMSRDLPAFAAKRCRDLCVRRDLITVVDTVDVVDDVRNQRTNVKGKYQTEEHGAMFLSRQTVRFVCDKLGPGAAMYPDLPHSLPNEPLLVQTQPPPRPCNLGMPKSVLRSRAFERRHRLNQMARINERRCQIFRSVRTKLYNPVESRSYSSRIGPDLVHFITRLIRQPYSPIYPTSVYPGLIQGHLFCQRSLTRWSCHMATTGHPFAPTNIDQAACLPSGPEPFKNKQLGPEAPIYFHRSSWIYDCSSLRLMLYNPFDYLSMLSLVLERFAFVIPSVISSGFLLETSCAKYQHELSEQDDRVKSLLHRDCLSCGCKQTLESGSKQLAGASKSLRQLPPSPMAWLLPSPLHRISTACLIQFPDPRLIQYDCGKLQRLDLLLRELKADNHRVLIFTQMARMLDILEQFLAYHGHPYLRLDGATKIEQRQVLMERFNQDTQIFVFILSTRSGGLGVNLTGADTVVFYDSDWNPTMDAQAQDRCHRIGQTRDVHIYRLISELTVEENILRKANQKRFLADVAIEGGRFTTAFFKQNTISELFAKPSGLQDLVNETPSEDKVTINVPSVEEQPPTVFVTRSGRQVRPRGDAATVAALIPAPYTVPISHIPTAEVQLAELMEQCEDENDRQAAERVLAEAKAELAEFDESIPLTNKVTASADEVSNSVSKELEVDPLTQFALNKRHNLMMNNPPESTIEEKAAENLHSQSDGAETEGVVERELKEFESTLRPIERFAVHFVEDQHEDELSEQLVSADVEFSESRESWRLDQLKALHAADSERADVEEDDMLYCSGTYDPSAQQMAELERLERLIAEEEIQQAMRKARERANKTAKSAVKPIPSDILLNAPSRVSIGEQTPASGRQMSEKFYTGSSESDTDSLSDECERPSTLNSNIQQWESFEPSDDDDFSTHIDRSHPQDRKAAEKRKTSQINFFPQKKIPRLVQQTTSVERVRSKPMPMGTTSPRQNLFTALTQPAFGKLQQKQPPSLNKHRFWSHVGEQSRAIRPQPFPNCLFENGPNQVAHEEIVVDSPAPSISTTQSSSGSGSDPISYRLRPFSNQQQQSSYSSQIPIRPKLLTPRIAGASIGHTQLLPRSPLKSKPRNTIGPGFPVPYVQQNATSNTIPPPRTQRPTEPVIPVHSVLNGNRVNMPAGQLLTPMGQPVFVITRQMTTPSGEVFQQRFAQPVASPVQFVQVINRLGRPTNTNAERPSLTTTTIPQATVHVSKPSMISVSPLPSPVKPVYSIPTTRFVQTTPTPRIGANPPIVRMLPGDWGTNRIPSAPIVRITAPSIDSAVKSAIVLPSTPLNSIPVMIAVSDGRTSVSVRPSISTAGNSPGFGGRSSQPSRK